MSVGGHLLNFKTCLNCLNSLIRSKHCKSHELNFKSGDSVYLTSVAVQRCLSRKIVSFIWEDKRLHIWAFKCCTDEKYFKTYFLERGYTWYMQRKLVRQNGGGCKMHVFGMWSVSNMNAAELALANSAGSQGVLKLRHMSGPWHSLCAFRCTQPGYVHRVS